MRTKSFILLPAVLLGASLNAQNPLAIPDTLAGTNFSLNIYDTSKVFYNGFTTNTYGVNGAYFGPTLFIKKGDSISMNVNNTIMDTTTIHWHGLHVSSGNDGGPHTVIAPGIVWSPKFKVRNKAATYWYHPHLHMMTNLHATKGAAGLIIVRDSTEAALTLPRRYGIDDFPLVIQSKAFDSIKQIVVNNAYDSVMMVNGTLNPFLQVPAQVVRLRLLNASSERVYNCGFTGNMSFYQITGDGGLLASPVSITRLRLAPGERAEILLDLSAMQGQTLNLMSYASEFPAGIYGASNPAAMGGGTIPGYTANILNGANFVILNLQVGAPTSNPVLTIPSSLVAQTVLSSSLAAITRTLTFSPQTMGSSQMVNGPFLINGTSFNMNVTNYTIPKDNIEIWQLTNNTGIAHPFHIHDVQFYLLTINGVAPPANMQGAKDVVLVPSQQTVRFITRFDNFCDPIPYMYHCHMLKHEDDGMMGQFAVQCNSVSGINETNAGAAQITVYPNPATSLATIILSGTPTDDATVFVFDSTGRKIYTGKASGTSLTLNIREWLSGLYSICVYKGNDILYSKLMIENK